MSSEPSDFDDYNVQPHSMHPVNIPESSGDEWAMPPIIEIIDIPTDQHEEIDEAIRQAHKGNSHTAINLLAEVVRGLL
jgi:hypothetical protein